MKIFTLQYNLNNSYKNNQQNVTFLGKGNPISLEYIINNHSKLLPQRVLCYTKKILKTQKDNQPSLMEIHKSIYKQLLDCKTLEEAKQIYPEFSNIKEKITFERNSIYAKNFYQKTNNNFALFMLKEYWANLKTKDAIAKSLGMKNRNSLDWALKQIDFIGFEKNYIGLLKASDEEGNKIIANKTTAWNALHPDLMLAKNKHAAQGCKTTEYRIAQSKRMIEYDKAHPERREKIGISSKATWEKCPEIKKAMSEFAQKETAYIRNILRKQTNNISLTEQERKVCKNFYKRFWETYPELKELYAKIRKELSKEKVLSETL